jgi:hypothetical protein
MVTIMLVRLNRLAYGRVHLFAPALTYEKIDRNECFHENDCNAIA